MTAASPGAHPETTDRDTVAQIREARDRLLARHAAAPDLDYKLLRMFASNELLAALSVPVLAIVVAVALMSWSEPRQLMLWLAVIFISKGILLLLCRRFVSLDPRDANVGLWRRHLTAAEFFYGMTWAVVSFVDLDPGNREAFFFLFALIMVVVAIRMIFALTVIPVIYAGTIPLTAALALRFVLTDDPFLYALAAVAVGIHICLIYLVKSLHFTVLAMLGYRAEKDALIAELEQARAVSEEARGRAEAASEAKSKFLATMSHELRTPLNAILGFSEVMKGEMLGPINNPAYKSYAADIHESGQHLLKLINEILDISRIEAGRYQLAEQPVNITATLQDCRRLLRLRSDGKGIRILTDFAPGLPKLWADERAVRQICLNIISNAIKFTPSGGTVLLRAGMTGAGEAYISVRDTGPGIPETEIEHVLTSFGQGSQAQDRAEGGTGLGLPIVRGLIALHGGDFELRSAVGVGTEVIVTFPRERVMLPQATRVAGEPNARSTPQDSGDGPGQPPVSLFTAHHPESARR